MHRNILLSILLVLFVFASASAYGVDIDDPAPDFDFMDLDGNVKSFHEEFSDSVVVIEWFAYW